MAYYLKKNWLANLGVVLLQIIYAAMRVTTNTALISLFQHILNRDLRSFALWAVLLIGLWTSILAMDSLRNWAMYRVIRQMNNQVRGDIAVTLLQMNHQNFHLQQSGEYLSWLTNDLNQIERLAWGPFYSMILTVFQVLFSVIILANMHWSLLVASLLTSVVIMNAPKLFGKKVPNLSKACAQEQAGATSLMKELLEGMDVLRAFGRTDRFLRGNQQASEQFEQPKYKLAVSQMLADKATSLVSVLCQMLVNAWIGILSIQGVIIQSALMGCGNLCGTIYNGLAFIGEYRLSFQASKIYFEKITVRSSDAHAQNRIKPDPIERAITMENVTFQYDAKPVVQNASFQFRKGGKYALTGPSGCGKSTVLKLLLGWLPDYTGSICFDGKNSRALTQEQIQQQMSYIEQNVFLFNTTIRENITLGEEFPASQLEKALRDSALAVDLANMPLGLDTPVGENGSSLSGGQKQRVAIARALIHNRSILLVDEGTSALDQKNADIVEKSLLRNPNLTLILVSHHLTPERKAHFDQVFQLEAVTASV